jgi:peptidoglycan/xylan/chitin deacetylase (PgdA/CDA1 family)
MKRHVLILALAFAASQAVLAEVEFLGPDLGKDNRLLFAARTNLPGDGTYDSLFQADLAGGGIVQLSAYPENMALVDGGRRLQIQNRFGLFRTDASLRNLSPVEGYPAFAQGAAVPAGSVLPAAPSPDGAWVLAAERTSPAYCRLVAVEISTGKRTLIADAVESEVTGFPARWSPDSRYFVYSKAGSLYYFSIEQLAGSRVLGEDYRRVGPGSIRSARWGRDSSLFYLRANSLYRILPAELFPQALYRGLAGMGVLAGATPFPYDPNFDDFWVSNDGSRMVLSKGGRNLFLLYLDPDDSSAKRRVSALPYLLLQGGTTVKDVLWPTGGPVTVFTTSIADGGRNAGAYRFDAPLDPADLDLAPAVRELDVKGAKELILSPDGTKVAVVTQAGVSVRGYTDWKSQAEIAEPDALHALWMDGGALVIASSHIVEKVELAGGKRSLVALSQVEAYGRAEDGSVVARSGGTAYRLASPSGQDMTAPGAGSWAVAAAFAPKAAATSSEAYRVYLEPTSAAPGPFRNLVMVRSIKAFGTTPLIPPPSATYVAFPAADEPRLGASFDHGSRIRRREIALTFDALDSSEGLTAVLNALKDYGIRATFFVNGEFVRRSPGSARILAASGQETGSMFFTTVDPTDARFSADRDYIRRGLAKAEDDWFAATGKELGLLWHTPYYSLNDDIIAAGASMNYTYIGRDFDSLDWVSAADAARMPGSYLDAHTIVERIVAKAKPGSIIPIRLGVPEGGRADYLFMELPLLLNALEEMGYDVVPVSTLLEHAK